MQTHTTATTVTAPRTADTDVPAPVSRALLASGAGATGLAILAVTAAHGLSRAAGVDLLVAGPDGSVVEVVAGTVVGMTVLGGLVAVLLALAVNRWAPRPRAAFVVTTVVGVIAYAGVPFAAAESLATAVWLNAYHVAVAAPLIALLGRRLPRVRA